VLELEAGIDARMQDAAEADQQTGGGESNRAGPGG
jgi:hypothetical protein